MNKTHINTLRIKYPLTNNKVRVYCIKCDLEAEVYKSNLVSPRVYYVVLKQSTCFIN